MIRVAVIGAKGRMGTEVVRAVEDAQDLDLVGAWDLGDDLAAGLADAEVAVEFTVPASGFENLRLILESGVRPVVGTTGFTAGQLDEADALCRERGLGGIVAPNFAIGAVLMMRYAAAAAPHFDRAEIVELHHDRKLDAPSGTALHTARGMAAARGDTIPPLDETETLAGSRGGEGEGGIRVHSVRMPGLVAHQEVFLGGPGQVLRIRHDTLDRSCFMPGVLLAVRKVGGLTGLFRDLGDLL
jgi:4-hydroxy-tetrahydrodipicolinate reductase